MVSSKKLLKALMVVPYSVDSGLVKEIREGEYDFERLNGLRCKIAEKAGKTIQDILTTLDPWRGQDCLRDACLP